MKKSQNTFGLLDRITIQPMTYLDLEQVCFIERKSFHRPWKPEGFRTEMEREPSLCLVLKDQRKVCGYVIFWLLVPEIHILNIAVHPEMRRLGLAGLLMDYLFEYAGETNVAEIFLEVRASNMGAQTFYRQRGFIETGIRKNYYAEDNEDAILMTRRL